MARHRVWQAMLDDLAARNESIEATPLADAAQAAAPAQATTESDSRPPLCRLRLLDVEADGSLLIEAPPTPTEAAAFADVPAVEVVVTDGGQRWAGRCPLLEVVQHPLNAQRTVAALRLGSAQQIYSAQRRDFFRVNTAGVELAPVSLRPPVQDGEAPAQPFQGRLLNLSGSGMGLQIEPTQLAGRKIRRGRRLCCWLQLPGEAEPLRVTACVVHAEPTPHETLYLGLRFEFPEAANPHPVQDRLVRFATELERQRLRRQRRG